MTTRKAILTIGAYEVREQPTGGWRITKLATSEAMAVCDTQPAAIEAATQFGRVDAANTTEQLFAEIDAAIDGREFTQVSRPVLPRKRTPFYVTVRRMATGCDYSAVLFLKSESDSFNAMARRVNLAHGVPLDGMRLIESRAATESEIAAHRARMATL